MKTGRYILYIFIPVLSGLLCLLGWNCRKMYYFEKKQVQEQIESAISVAAGKVQWYNGSLSSSYALMLTDPDYSSKVAFAAGFNHNKGKISIDFFANDGDTPRIYSPGFDTMPQLNKSFLRDQNIKYKPELVWTIKQFDSFFSIELTKNKTLIPYRVAKSKRADSTTKDTIVSSVFIIDFFFPHIYCVHYTIPAMLVIRNITPYLGATLLVCTLLILVTVSYYRIYRLQAQQTQFKESLFGNITHELKTPLTSLQLIIDNAKGNISGSPEVQVSAKHIHFADNELTRMKLIVDRILSFSKMSREQFAFNQEQVNLDEVITESIKVMELNIMQAGGKIIFTAGKKVDLLGDHMLLVNAISAIIDNAIKYSDQKPEINIKLINGQGHATISIEDNGTGIPQKYNKKIFEPFFRIPTGNVYNTSGHGLGLSFVEQVVKLHGGMVSFSSSEKGTAFYLKFKIS